MNEDERKAGEAIDALEAESDQWAEAVNLRASIDHISHISRMAHTVPMAAREKMIGRQKALLDALAHGGAYEDDSQVARLSVVRREVIPEGKVVVRIRRMRRG